MLCVYYYSFKHLKNWSMTPRCEMICMICTLCGQWTLNHCMQPHDFHWLNMTRSWESNLPAHSLSDAKDMQCTPLQEGRDQVEGYKVKVNLWTPKNNRGSQCKIYTDKPVDTGKQTFDTLLSVKKTYSKNTVIWLSIVALDYPFNWISCEAISYRKYLVFSSSLKVHNTVVNHTKLRFWCQIWQLSQIASK